MSIFLNEMQIFTYQLFLSWDLKFFFLKILVVTCDQNRFYFSPGWFKPVKTTHWSKFANADKTMSSWKWDEELGTR